MGRRISEEALAHLKRWEGLRLDAYRDGGGVWTIGYGHTAAAGAPRPEAGMTITEVEAERILRADLAWAERAVERHVAVPLGEGQFGALVSFVFNVGETAFAGSTLLRRLNAGDYAAVPEQLQRWVHDGGRRVEGLVNRRAAEAGLWARDGFVASNTVEPAPVRPRPLRSPEAVGLTLTGIGGVLTEAARQIEPYIGFGAIARWTFFGLFGLGIALTALAASRRILAGGT